MNATKAAHPVSWPITGRAIHEPYVEREAVAMLARE